MQRENLLKLPQSSPFSLFYFSISMSLSLQEGETLSVSGVDHEVCKQVVSFNCNGAHRLQTFW